MKGELVKKSMGCLFLLFALIVMPGCGSSAGEPEAPEAKAAAQEAAVEQEGLKDSLEYKLAVIQYGASVSATGSEVQEMRQLLDSLEAKTKNTRQECADMSVRAMQLLNEEGIGDDLLTTMRALDESMPDGLDLSLADVAAAYLTLRTQ